MGGGTGLGAQRGEIPAASAGMTDLFCAGRTEEGMRVGRGRGRGCEGAWTGLGAQRGEIPAASAGMTDLFCAGVTEEGVRVERGEGAGRTDLAWTGASSFGRVGGWRG